MAKNTYALVGGIILIGICASLVLGFVNSTASRTEFSDYGDDAEVYNAMALALAERGTLLDENGAYYGWGRRAPGYPLVLAGAYAVWPSPVSAWVLQEIFFTLSIYLFWRIAQFFLNEQFSLIATALYATVWFISAFVVRIGSDFLGLFWGIVFLWAYLSYSKAGEKHALFFLTVSAIALGLMAITRPAIAYFAVGAAVFLFFAERTRRSVGKALIRSCFFLLVVLLVVLPWMWWSYETMGTPQLASAGYIFDWRSHEALWSYKRIAVSFVAALLGDAAADVLVPGYAAYPDPLPQKDRVIPRRLAMQAEGIPEKDIDTFFYEEGARIVFAHPVKFFLTGLINIVRLHAPPNREGVSMSHFLAESASPLSVRLGANIFVRGVWAAFLVVAAIGMWRYIQRAKAAWCVWVMLGLFILYIVGIQAFMADAEFRYILPVMPLYLLFFTYSFYERRIAT